MGINVNYALFEALSGTRIFALSTASNSNNLLMNCHVNIKLQANYYVSLNVLYTISKEHYTWFDFSLRENLDLGSKFKKCSKTFFIFWGGSLRVSKGVKSERSLPHAMYLNILKNYLQEQP